MELKNFRIEEEDWKKFKELAREEGSNASVELRKFIKKYNEEKEYRRMFDEIFSDHKETLDSLAE